MDVQVHSWFQGYNIYYQKDGDVNHNKITVQAYKNNVLLVNPRPYIFLRIWITAYSIKGESPPSTEITESYGGTCRVLFLFSEKLNAIRIPDELNS